MNGLAFIVGCFFVLWSCMITAAVLALVVLG